MGDVEISLIHKEVNVNLPGKSARGTFWAGPAGQLTITPYTPPNLVH